MEAMKSTKCMVCRRTVHLKDEVKHKSIVYHNFCFLCNHCKGTLKASATSIGVSIGGRLYHGNHTPQIEQPRASRNPGPSKSAPAWAQAPAHTQPPANKGFFGWFAKQ